MVQRGRGARLGALVDLEGTWATTPDHVDLEQWRHLSTLGRDHYVRVDSNDSFDGASGSGPPGLSNSIVRSLTSSTVGGPSATW